MKKKYLNNNNICSKKIVVAEKRGNKKLKGQLKNNNVPPSYENPYRLLVSISPARPKLLSTAAEVTGYQSQGRTRSANGPDLRSENVQ